jgi:hypothetical protein
VHGGIHFHLTPSSSPAPQGAPGSVLRRSRILAGWVRVLTLLFLAAGFGSYFINVSVGRGSLSRNLVADAVLVVVSATLLATRWRLTKATEMSFPTYLGKLLDRCTPKILIMTSTRLLSMIAIAIIVLLLTSMATPSTGQEFTAAQGQNGVLIIFTTLDCLVGNTLVRRWRNRSR